MEIMTELGDRQCSALLRVLCGTKLHWELLIPDINNVYVSKNIPSVMNFYVLWCHKVETYMSYDDFLHNTWSFFPIALLLSALTITFSAGFLFCF